MKKKILLIDDDRDFRKAIKTVLEQSGYICFDAQTSKQGFQKMLKMKPDLIILDEMLEDISSGFRFAKKLLEREKKKNHIHIPIIMITNIQKVTGLDFKKYIGTPLLPIDGFFEKPVKQEQLLKKIENILN